MNGYVLWEGDSPLTGDPLVAVATMKTTNRKTGPMVQVWILRRDVSPLEAIKSGGDRAICGDCPLRGRAGKQRGCYVVVAQAPTSVWKTYCKGGYTDASGWSDDEVAALFTGRKVRLGAYGDPAMLPIGRVRAIIRDASGWTGYTHQWRTADAEWSGMLMASADSLADRRTARKLGYRSFALVPAGEAASGHAGAMECSATRERNPVGCSECMACAGTRHGTVAGAVDVVITAHGSGAKYIA